MVLETLLYQGRVIKRGEAIDVSRCTGQLCLNNYLNTCPGTCRSVSEGKELGS